MGSGERLGDDEIAAIAARAEAATPGPWETSSPWSVRAVPLDDELVAVVQLRDHAPDGRFIAAARTDVPRLLGECARLRAVEAAAISACELEGGPGEDAALADLRAALRGGQ